MLARMRHTAVLLLGLVLLALALACGNTQPPTPTPSPADEHIERGDDHSRKGHYKEAIESYNEAIRLDPQNAKAYNNRGLTYQSLGKVEEAERDFQKAKELGYNP